MICFSHETNFILRLCILNTLILFIIINIQLKIKLYLERLNKNKMNVLITL